jgi:diketogulonate reductase-like aldo/keto reductase
VDVPTRDLGDGILMPMLGLGVWQSPAGSVTRQAIEWALEAGYRHIDTATYYRNETDVGAALAASGIPREELFVTTKWMPALRSAPTEIRRSLERLDMAFVDLYLIHWPLPGRTSWSPLEKIREQGLARAIGVSNYGSDRLTKLLDTAKVPPAVNQVQFSPFHYRKALLELCDRRGVVLEAYSPLERGKALGNAVVGEIAARLEREPAQVMLRWGIQHGAVVIPKSTHRERIVSNAQIFDFELSDEDMSALDGLDETGGTGSARAM